VSSYIELSYWQLAATSVFVFIDAALSVLFGLRVHRSLLFAAIRMVVQLALVGVVLTTLFSVISPLWTGLAAFVMVFLPGTRRHSGRSDGFRVGGRTDWAPAA
jgi:putative ABC transport system permease protein